MADLSCHNPELSISSRYSNHGVRLAWQEFWPSEPSDSLPISNFVIVQTITLNLLFFDLAYICTIVRVSNVSL